MLVELDKKGLIDLVSGSSPHYDLFEHPTVKKCGTFNGSYGSWSWHLHELKELSEVELYKLYIMCSDSW